MALLRRLLGLKRKTSAEEKRKNISKRTLKDGTKVKMKGRKDGSLKKIVKRKGLKRVVTRFDKDSKPIKTKKTYEGKFSDKKKVDRKLKRISKRVDRRINKMDKASEKAWSVDQKDREEGVDRRKRMAKRAKRHQTKSRELRAKGRKILLKSRK